MAPPNYDSADINRWMRAMSVTREDTSPCETEFPISPVIDYAQVASSLTGMTSKSASHRESPASGSGETSTFTISARCAKRSAGCGDAQSENGIAEGSAKRLRYSYTPLAASTPNPPAADTFVYPNFEWHRQDGRKTEDEVTEMEETNHIVSRIRATSLSQEEQTTVISSYWPEIRDDYYRSLCDPSIRFCIPCLICQENCADVRTPPCTVNFEMPVILACGHMIGENCLKEWFQAREHADEPKNCPVCRMKLQCSECKDAFAYSFLCHDSHVPNTQTYSEQPMEQTICNQCQAETDFGSRVLQGEHIAEPFPGGGVSQHLQAWFRQVRDTFETEAKIRVGHGLRPIDVTGMVHKEIFAEMEAWLYFLKENVTYSMQGRIETMERELDQNRWWNRASADSEDESEDYEGEGYDEDESLTEDEEYGGANYRWWD
ncbi:hypothetical protein CORC01_13007 [Colletotrichum orchidophilum]|uniref:RING-type domain-containing protein n=1 Tax=Colletotrichum orchidophilum TaxID=1209926 RepID=A0A1G4ARI0_9PEZI|nr:uncharacterized protein CORC01_13007 [Colletotrichum orchidophilum]OHE91716.1 hypothetical protein CORC01_13007 [Colletotrichum orchidophilum]